MGVQARFYVREVHLFAQEGNSKVILSPISGSKGDENAQWSKYTPSGEITMSVTNPDATMWFMVRRGKPLAISFDDTDDVV
jgi:hypothetical protein